MIGMTALAVVAFAALIMLKDQETVAAAYGAFVATLVIWGWHEASFLTGMVTGPLQSPEKLVDKRGFVHFAQAAQAIIYHELAIAVTGLALIWLLADAGNQVGLWTYMVLWLMRLSAKFNLYLGVPNMNEELLPDHLRFLKRYFTKRPINYLFPVSITLPTLIAGAMLVHLWVFPQSPFNLVATSITGTLLALAVLEHWFLILPIADSALWRWAISDHSVSLPKPFVAGSSKGELVQ